MFFWQFFFLSGEEVVEDNEGAVKLIQDLINNKFKIYRWLK